MCRTRRPVICFSFKRDGAETVPLAGFEVLCKAMQYSLLHAGQHFTLEMLVRAGTEKEPWKNLFSMKTSGYEVVKELIENPVLCRHLKKWLCSALMQKPASGDVLLEWLWYSV